MPAIRIQPFEGMTPKLSANLLAANAAQAAHNVKLISGELRAWRKPVIVGGDAGVVPGAKTIHKLYGANGASAWMSWASDVDVVGSPMSDLSDFRIYYAGDGTPRKTNWALGVSGPGPHPNDYLEMGVPAPTAAPTVTPTSGTGTVENRVYLNTFISTFGSIKEESAPSPPATCSLAPVGGSVLINGFAAPPVGKYNITHRRIYRTLAGTATYGLVAEIPIGTASYTDTTPTGTATTTLQSTYWTPPPSDLKGLVAMPNGMIAGFRGNEVWFCEPYYPHAWPAPYMLTVDYPVVGLGVYGSVLVVMTERIPYLMYGAHPSVMTQETVQIAEPCVAKRAIANDEQGVIYPSPNGIVGIGQAQRGLISGFAYSRDEWQKVVPSGLFGRLYGQNYIVFNSSEVAQGRKGIVVPREGQGGISDIFAPATCFYVDRKTGNTYYVSEIDNILYQLDGDEGNYSMMEWKSKRFAVPRPVAFTCFQVDADFLYMNDLASWQALVASIVAANALVIAALPKVGLVNGASFNSYRYNGSNVKDVPALYDLRYINVTFFANGEQVYSAQISDIDPLRLPEINPAYNWEVQITANVPVRSFAMATSVAELQQI